ncbi:MAG: PepSY domain-containing protein, partial [Candidatus Thermoplasmatota archaeon]
EELIGHEESLNIAFQRVEGMLVDFELGEEDDTYVYGIDIVDRRREYEIEIDAYTGEVLESEVDDDGMHRRERGVGRSWNGTQGNFTSFDLLEDGISNYTLHTNNTNLLLFESVRIQDMIIEETETQGAHYEIEGNETGIRIYDVAPALMKINTESEEEPGKVSFDLGDLEAGEQEGPNLNLSYGNYTAKLLSVSQGDGPWDESLNINVSEGTVNYTFEEDLFLVFRMTDFETQEMEQEREGDREREREHEKEREMEQNISDGISQGKVGGEVIVDRDEKGFSETSVSYADMQMMTQAQENDRIRVMVSSDSLGDEGKIVGIKIYKEALDVDRLEELEITFDGEEIGMADDYDDLVESSDEAQYLVSMGSESTEVLVMVPHFSTHSIEIARADTGIGSLIDVQYYIPVAIITGIIVLSTVWITKKEH